MHGITQKRTFVDLYGGGCIYGETYFVFKTFFKISDIACRYFQNG